jgi:hypothetical protein
MLLKTNYHTIINNIIYVHERKQDAGIEIIQMLLLIQICKICNCITHKFFLGTRQIYNNMSTYKAPKIILFSYHPNIPLKNSSVIQKEKRTVMP